MAHELLAARAARIRRIRHRVVAGTVAAFALAWGVVAFDGSKGQQTTTTAQASTTSTDATPTYSTSGSAATQPDNAPPTLSTGQS